MNIEQQIADDHRRFSRHYEEILHRHSRLIFSLSQSTSEQDMTEGFDYAITFDKVQIAVRNRAYKYFADYGDFTIRAQSKMKNKTEIHKIKEGCGDVYLYAWKNQHDTNLYCYLLIDLNKLRSSGVLYKNRRLIPNIDGTKFISITLHELHKADCILAYDKFSKT